MKKYLGKFTALALVLTMASTSLVGGTLAKYTTEVEGSGTVSVAAWDVAFTADNTAYEASTDLDLSGTKDTNSNVGTDVIAPGDSGSFTVNAAGTDTEVAFSYTIAIDETSLTTTTAPIKFYSDNACSVEWDDTAEFDVTLNDANTGSTQTIYWVWDTTNTDANDTTAGTAAGDVDFTITITATQTVAD